jgi:hypothetical protein
MRGLARWMRGALVGAAVSVPAPTPPALPAAPTATSSPASPPVQDRKKKKRTAPQTHAQCRWLQKDVEDAQRAAASGDLSKYGRLYRALGRDGMLLGLMGTRSNGLVRLPKRFSGNAAGVAYLEGSKGKRGKFSKHFPNSEIGKLARDGFVCGYGVGEFVETCFGLVLVRLDPEFVVYRWWDDTWWYRSAQGLIQITPGDGRWVLYTPGGRQDPWEWGALPSLARAYISKEHALFYRENWNSKLAHPARVAIAPQGASEVQKEGWFKRVLAWGVNTVFGLTPGYDVKLLESNGRGYESFRETIADSNTEFMVSVAGQVVTVTGGTGFANANIHATIRGDLIEGDGMSLAECLCEQALPHVLVGIVPDVECVDFEWDTRPPQNRKEEAEALSAAAKAIGEIVRTLAAQGLPVDVQALTQRFGVPLAEVQAVVDSALQPANDCDVEVTFDADGEIVGPGDATVLTDEAVEHLAEVLTELGAEECRHGKKNRCWMCSVERVDEPYRAEDGSIAHTVQWRPIPMQVAA